MSSSPAPQLLAIEGSGNAVPEPPGMGEARSAALERCLRVLRGAASDSEQFAALLLVTKLAQAGDLSPSTRRRVFDAVGFSLPNRLLVTVETPPDCPPQLFRSLAVSLLAGFSTDPGLAAHPELINKIPLLLGLVSAEPEPGQERPRRDQPGLDLPEQSPTEPAQDGANRDQPGPNQTTQRTAPGLSPTEPHAPGQAEPNQSHCGGAGQQTQPCPDLATIQDSYQCLTALALSPRGPRILLSRGAVPALCRAHTQRCPGHAQALPVLTRILSGAGPAAWQRHEEELTRLLVLLSSEFARSGDSSKFTLCEALPHFLPPPAGAARPGLRPCLDALCAGLREVLGARLSVAQRDPALRLAACLLDGFGAEWLAGSGPGSGQFLALLVNLACVEVRMALEEPEPDSGSARRDTVTACYRILEFGMEACSLGLTCPDAPPGKPPSGLLTLAQSQQVLGVMEEAVAAVIFYLAQVAPVQYRDPFVFASVRLLCAWLAEETSSLKQEVCDLLPFLIGYGRALFEGEERDCGLTNQMEDLSVTDSGEGGDWPGDALRFLLPGLCHLSVEEGPRAVLLSQGSPALLLRYLSHLLGRLGAAGGCQDQASLQTACSVFLNLTVTEPEIVRTDPSFSSLQTLLMDSLPSLIQKPPLLILAAHFCTLGLLMARLLAGTPALQDSAPSRRFARSALLFLSRAHTLDSDGAGRGVVRSARYSECWEDVGELWFLGMQALGGCVAQLPWLADTVLQSGWLGDALKLLRACPALADPDLRGALQAVLTPLAQHSQACRDFIRKQQGEVIAKLHCMTELQRHLAGTG
ncbi:neurochondrin [Acipenser oxyrinchus oxyrinchus]|uniref:Neurochondrin n=1 Tax=Acipenser oxyrinchus oxyrinchus TaxID=40147 RepID=A0AAD8CU25_ACIOX|nr:neurochondrin [Acipenser oxyrinchus oxyrinchus]